MLYLGLVIDEAFNLSSVLRGDNGFDGFTGCYAFGGWVYDYAITSNGDMRAIMSPDNRTMLTDTYKSSGWNSYPAGNTWTPPHHVATAPAARSIQEVRVAAGLRDTLWTVRTERPSNGSSTGGIDRPLSSLSQAVSVVSRTTLSDTDSWKDYIQVQGALGAAVDWASTGTSSPSPSGIVCTAALVPTTARLHAPAAASTVAAQLQVHCAQTSPGPAGQPDVAGTWKGMGTALSAIAVDT